jgi:hypothetical protein
MVRGVAQCMHPLSQTERHELGSLLSELMIGGLNGAGMMKDLGGKY